MHDRIVPQLMRLPGLGLLGLDLGLGFGFAAGAPRAALGSFW